jgi:exopolysaccharide biosynthesis polyprenyl glycosylphosphotransferase
VSQRKGDDSVKRFGGPEGGLSPATIQFVIDLVTTLGGWAAVLVISNITEPFVRSNERSIALTLVAASITMIIMDRRGLYDGRPTLPRTEEISRVMVAVLAGTASVAVAGAFLDWQVGAWELAIGGTGVFAARTLIRGLLRSLSSELPSTAAPARVVVVGSGTEARELVELIIDHPEARFELAGVVGNLGVAERSGLADLWIGPTGRLVELMHQHEVNGAIVTATGFRSEQFRSITKELFGSGYDVHLTTGVSRMWEGRFDVRSLAHEPLIVMGRNEPAPWEQLAKRAIDVVGATVAILAFSPVMILAALAIKLEDRGAITYTARRAGRRGEYFEMYKFRSMVPNADKLKKEIESKNERTGPLFKVTNDPRITRVGKIIRETSIDELPQLFNVLKGDMSLVGPRPALPEEQKAFDDELRERTSVRPGITGLWQVEARSNAAFNAYRRLDLHYVENWNIGLDLRILLATAEQVIVTFALLPLRFMRRRSDSGIDGIQQTSSVTEAQDPQVVIDLRDRSRARMAAAEGDNEPLRAAQEPSSDRSRPSGS